MGHLRREYFWVSPSASVGQSLCVAYLDVFILLSFEFGGLAHYGTLLTVWLSPACLKNSGTQVVAVLEASLKISLQAHLG